MEVTSLQDKNIELIQNFLKDIKNVINNDKEHMIAEKINFSYLFEKGA